MLLSNVMLGGALTLAAPVLAWVLRGRADKEVKRRAMEEAPKVVLEAATKLADGFDAEIDAFADKLADFVGKASEEMTKSLADVVRTAREAKREGDASIERLTAQTGSVLVRLGTAEDRMRQKRAALAGAVAGTAGVVLH
jgi:hypothetical protein